MAMVRAELEGCEECVLGAADGPDFRELLTSHPSPAVSVCFSSLWAGVPEFRTAHRLERVSCPMNYGCLSKGPV